MARPIRFIIQRRVGILLCTAVLFTVASVAASCGSSSPSSTASQASGEIVAGVTITADSELHAMLPEAVVSAGEVRVACDIPYPPWAMYTAPGSKELTGIDYDVGQALGAKLGIPFVYKRAVFDAIIPGLQANKFDCAITAMIDTKERQEVLDFVDYAKDGMCLLVEKGNPGNITGLDSLAGTTVAVQSSTAQEAFLKKVQAQIQSEGKPALKILQFPEATEVQLAVQAGKAIAAMEDAPVSAWLAKTVDNGNAWEIVVDPSQPNGWEPSLVGCGILKSNVQLRDAIQKAMQSLMDDGTYGRILEEYRQSTLGIPEATINMGQ